MTDAGAVSLPHEQAGGSSRNLLSWALVILLVYVLISAVGIIGSGFKSAAGAEAKTLFNFATNPFVGLMIGLVATALIQSSSTVTSVIVGLVGGGMPVAIAVPMVMGSNIGTSLTNTLVSLGHVRDKAEFRRAFSAATVHDFFNLLAVALFLPLEIAFGVLEKSAAWIAGLLSGAGSYSMSDVNFIKTLTEPLTGALEAAAKVLPAPFDGIALIVVGLALIFLSILYMGKLLKKLMVGRAKAVLHSAIGRGPIAGISSGAAVTILVQSSSTTTSLMVPLAGSGIFSIRQIYPFMLGANIGTTITALLAATAVSGALASFALEIAFVHVLFNVFAVALIFSVPFLRDLPIRGAEWLGYLASERKIWAVAWVVGVFFILPALLIGATLLF